MERVYPYLSHNLVRLDMTPIVVPDSAYDMALDSEWSNPYGVPRVDKPAPSGEEKPKSKGGRPRKANP